MALVNADTPASQTKTENNQTDRERHEAKIKQLREREEANRQEYERRKQLTEEQHKAEDKARHEAKLKEMQNNCGAGIGGRVLELIPPRHNENEIPFCVPFPQIEKNQRERSFDR
jgi:hypothetical protein